MMRHFALTIAGMNRRLDRRLSEWANAVAMVLAGLILMFGTTFELPPYEVVIGRIAGQTTWGWALIAVGLARLVVLTVNGALPRGSPHLRSGLSSLSAIIWSVLLAGFLALEPTVLVSAFLAAALGADLVNAFRAAQDARLEDDQCGAANGNATG